MPIKVRDLKKALLIKGFRESNRGRRRKHVKYTLYYKGLQTSLFTFVSHGEDELGSILMASVARQMNLSRDQLLDFVNCPLSGETYLQMQIGCGRVIP